MHWDRLMHVATSKYNFNMFPIFRFQKLESVISICGSIYSARSEIDRYDPMSIVAQ